MNTITELQTRIKQTCEAHPDQKARWKAMRQIKWRLHYPQSDLWAGMRGLDIVAVDNAADAITFDGRDNEVRKLDFYRRTTGIQWEIQLCAS